MQGEWQRSQQGILARVLYTQPASHLNTPQLASLKTYITPMVNGMINTAHAQTVAQTAAQPSTVTPATVTPATVAQLTATPSTAIQSHPALPGALGIAKQPNALFDARLIYHAGGDVLLQQQFGQGIQQTQAYAYDRQHQLVAAQSTTNNTAKARTWRYHYDQNGNRDLAQENVAIDQTGLTLKTAYHSTNAAISTYSAQHYQWNALVQLTAVKQDQQTIAQYSYNAYGLRVKKQVLNVPSKQTTQDKPSKQTSYTLYNLQRQRIADVNS